MTASGRLFDRPDGPAQVHQAQGVGDGDDEGEGDFDGDLEGEGDFDGVGDDFEGFGDGDFDGVGDGDGWTWDEK